MLGSRDDALRRCLNRQCPRITQCVDADACIRVTHSRGSRAQCASGRWTSTPGRITSPSGSAALTAPVNPDNAPVPTYKAARCVIDPPRLDPFPGVSQGEEPAGVGTLSSDAGIEGFDERIVGRVPGLEKSSGPPFR